MPVYQYTWTSLKLRADKSVFAEVLSVIPSHTKYEGIEADRSWLKVIYDEQMGYVFKQAVSISEHINQDCASVQSAAGQII